MDFFKAYDIVEWNFLPKKKIDFFREFNFIIILLLVNILIKINFNGCYLIFLFITREVRQGCLLDSYLFFVVEESFNFTISKEIKLRAIKKIQLHMKYR